MPSCFAETTLKPSLQVPEDRLSKNSHFVILCCFLLFCLFSVVSTITASKLSSKVLKDRFVKIAISSLKIRPFSKFCHKYFRVRWWLFLQKFTSRIVPLFSKIEFSFQKYYELRITLFLFPWQDT